LKKLLLTLLLVVTMSIVWAVPAFAADPPGMDVDVTVITPGDVDLDVAIVAGGNVDVSIGGVDIRDAIAAAGYHAPENRLWDYSYYWNLSGIGPRIEGQIAKLGNLSTMLLDASAKLIEGHQFTRAEISYIQKSIDSLESETAGLLTALQEADTDTATSLASLQERDEVIWNQLMYGAEYHISLLEVRATEQDTRIAELEAQASTLSAELNTAGTNFTALLNYTDYLQRQYLYYFWIIGGVMLVLVISLISVARRNKS